jgi:aldose sugar dehydrogenase
MKKFYLNLLMAFTVSSWVQAQVVTPSDSSNSFTYRVLASNLSYPWEVSYGPDDSLWVTESRSYKITKVSTINGGKRTILDLSGNKNFYQFIDVGGNRFARVGASNKPWPQGGMQGLALHPQLLTGKPYVYVAYVYRWDSTSVNTNGGEFFKTKIERYTYNTVTKTLGSPVVIIDTLPGSSDHNSGRLTIGPDLKLYYSIGDMGAGQFGNKNRTHYAQNLDYYQGKILRFNTEEDGDVFNVNDPLNRWIPNDNVYFNSVTGNRSAVYTYGHRNVQGLVWGEINSGDTLYANEHGPQTDDELNTISRGRNYGYPFVTGLCDGNMNGISNGPFTAATVGSNTEQNRCTALNVKIPISTFGTTDPTPATNPEGSNATWPTVGPSSIDFYGNSNIANQIPNWKNSILMTTLRSGRIIRLKLNANGNGVVGSPIEYFRGSGNRFRDLALNPDGLTIYVATDSGYSTSGPTAGIPPSSLPAYAGVIIEFRYSAAVLSANDTPPNPLNYRQYFKVFPNPVTGDMLYVESKRNVGKPLTYQLYDATGNLVKSGRSTNNNFGIEMKGLSKGMYILKVYNGAEVNVVTEKVVRQ